MNCDECRASMAEIWTGGLPDAERAEAELHLAGCGQCKSEVDRLRTIWDSLGRIPAETPARGMRSRFYERLDAYQQGFGESRLRGSRWWNAIPALHLATAAALVALAFVSGFWMNDRRGSAELSLLRSEIGNMRQLVTLSLLQQQNASDRLKGVNWAYRTEQPDTEVLAALLYTVNHDPNVDVRLAAVDALRTYAESPIARRGMTQAVTKQKSPMVQIALIDQIVEMRDEKAVNTLRGLVKDSQVDPEVRQRAEWALGRMQ